MLPDRKPPSRPFVHLKQTKTKTNIVQLAGQNVLGQETPSFSQYCLSDGHDPEILLPGSDLFEQGDTFGFSGGKVVEQKNGNYGFTKLFLEYEQTMCEYSL